MYTLLYLCLINLLLLLHKLNSRFDTPKEFWSNGNQVYDGREVPEVDLMMGLNGPVKERYDNMIDHSGLVCYIRYSKYVSLYRL